jgi:hypothetical protein
MRDFVFYYERSRSLPEAITHGQMANLLLEFLQGDGGTPTYAGV